MDTTDQPQDAPSPTCSCELAEQLQQDSFLDQVAEQQQEELGYVLPVMAELYSETTLTSPIDSVLESEACSCPAPASDTSEKNEESAEKQP